MRQRSRSIGRLKPLVLAPQSRLLAARNCYLKPAYQHRQEPHAFDDSVSTVAAWQPYVYYIAGALAARAGARWIIDLGCGNGSKLAKLHPRFKIIGIDTGRNLDLARRRFPHGHWIAWDLERPDMLDIDHKILKQAVVISSDVIEHLLNPARLLQTLKHMLTFARFALVSTPERDLTRGTDDDGPPSNTHHIREWCRTEFADLLEASGFRLVHCGLTESNSVTNEQKTILAAIEHRRRPPVLARQAAAFEARPARRKYARHYGLRQTVRSGTDPITIQLDAALAHLKAGRTDACVPRLLAILSADPGNRPATRMLDHIITTLRHATHLHRAGNLEEAEFLYHHILAIQPDHPLANQLLALTVRQALHTIA